MREDGVIFISIDDGEVDNLRRLCDEIFGEENRVEIFVWQSIFRPSNMSKSTRTNGEFVLCYTRAEARTLEMVERREEPQGAASLTQNNNRGRTLRFPASSLATTLPDGTYPAAIVGDVQLHDDLIVRNGTNVEPFRLAGRFKWSQEYLDSEVAKGVTLLMRTTSFIPYYRKDYQRTALRPTKILPRDLVGDVLAANAEMSGLLGSSMYDYPKPSTLVRFFASAMGTATDDIVLDFFAGSGTTAHAVLDLNKQDGGNRKFILVQLPEPTEREEYATIADITKERVRRVIKKLNDEDAGKLDLGGKQTQDRGFRVFKLAESNFNPWNADVPHETSALEEQLELHVDHIRQGRTREDLLYEILLKSGFKLTTPVETLQLAGTTVHSVARGALLVCLERELTLDLIRAIAERAPERVVCLDEGFAGNDQLKANAVQIFKTQGVTSFRTA
jgi:adenine-specific DNA-methyltransferase